MHLTFDHLEQRGSFFKASGTWLICTVEFTEDELKILRTPNLAFSASIGTQFWVGRPDDRRRYCPKKSRQEKYDEEVFAIMKGVPAKHDHAVPITLKYILSGKPISIFLPSPSPAEITAAEKRVTNVFSELKSLMEANVRVPGKRTIEI